MLTQEPQLKQKITEIESTVARIKQISGHLRYQNKERISRTALFNVQIKHTNEFIVELGSDYFCQMRAQNAVKLMEFRLSHYKQRLKKIHPEVVKTNEVLKKQGQTLGKQNTIKLDGSHTGFLQCIGQENGQSIFNIVEIEGEEQQSSSPTHDKVDKAPLSSQTNLQKKTLSYSQTAIIDKEIGSIPTQNLETTSPGIEPQIESNKSKSQSQSHQSSQEQCQGQYDDIIMSHRAKIGLMPQPTSTEADVPKVHPPEKQQKKEQLNKIVEEEQIPQKISRFKLQRMKQKLQQQLQLP